MIEQVYTALFRQLDRLQEVVRAGDHILQCEPFLDFELSDDYWSAA
jgi:hypothetical protein